VVWKVCSSLQKVEVVRPQLALAAQDGHCWSVLADCATNGIDDYAGDSDIVADVVVAAAESGEKLKRALIKRAGQGCELAGRARLEVPMDADDGTLMGKKEDEAVSGPLSSRERGGVCMKGVAKGKSRYERTRGGGGGVVVCAAAKGKVQEGGARERMTKGAKGKK
jgi:hypothetical protein